MADEFVGDAMIVEPERLTKFGEVAYPILSSGKKVSEMRSGEVITETVKSTCRSH